MSACPGCGLDLPDHDGAAHAYLSVSPACWALFGRSLELHYSQAVYWPAHQLLTDAYTLQHSVSDDPRARRSALVHLGALALGLGGGTESQMIALRRRLSKVADPPRLDPPAPSSRIDAVPVDADPQAHIDGTRAYADAVLTDWAPQIPRIRQWTETA